jgi:glycosyltransferase involved in cell wall biosynthesis
MSRAARNNRVIFFEEPLFEGNDTPYLRLHGDSSGVTVAEPILPLSFGMEVEQTLRTLFDDLLQRLDKTPDILWYYTPMALDFSRHIQSAFCVYDNMDELSAFRGASPKLLNLEEELFGRAEAVFTGGHSLFKAKRHRHDNIHSFPSSIDVRHFGQSRSKKADPADQAALPHPRLGFFGVIDERMDLALVADIARRRPHWQLIMIGPVAKIDPATLPRASNIAWLGMKSYDELPSHLSGWDVGIMPFARNESTKYISPTKTPEFLAAGVPVICTRIADVVQPYGELGLAEIEDDAEGFIAASERLFGLPKREWLEKVDRHLSCNSWDKTWSAMEAFLPKAGAVSVALPCHSIRGDGLHV